MKHLHETANDNEVNIARFTNQLQARIIINIGIGQGCANIKIPFEDEHGVVTDVPLSMFIKTLISDATIREF